MFFYEAPNLLPTSKSMFRARLPSRKTQLIFWKRRKPCHTNRFSTLYETLSWNATLPPLDAAVTVRFAENTQHDTSEVLRLPLKTKMEVTKVLRLPRKTQLIFWKRRKPCHTNRFSTLYETPSWNATLPPLDAAVTVRFAENTQHDTSEVLRLPLKTKMEVTKVLRLPRKTQLIFWKRRKPCHTNRLSTLYENTLKCHKVPRLPRETRLRDTWNLQKWPLLQNSPEAKA